MFIVFIVFITILLLFFFLGGVVSCNKANTGCYNEVTQTRCFKPQA